MKTWTGIGASVEGYKSLLSEGATALEVGDPSVNAYFHSRPLRTGEVGKHGQGYGHQSVSIGGGGGSQLLFRETLLPSGDRQPMSSLIFTLEDAGEWAGLTPFDDGSGGQISVVDQVMCHALNGKGLVYFHAPTADELVAAGVLTSSGDLCLTASKRVKTGEEAMKKDLPMQLLGIELTGAVNQLAHIAGMPANGPLYAQPGVALEADTIRVNMHPESFRQAPVVVASPIA